VPPANKPVIWLHGDNLSPFSPALTAHPGAPALWVWDDELLARGRVSFKRIVFLAECLTELPATTRRGDVAQEVLRFAAAHGANQVVTNASPSPRFAAICRAIERTLPVAVLDGESFVTPSGTLDLLRFSRYWRKVERAAVWGNR
jgi:deoxyribodipyrimidine photo-lyase